MSRISDMFDGEAAYTYLELLQPDNCAGHEFCWFGQKHGDGWVKQEYGTFEYMYERLIDWNEGAFSIFVCVNAIDVPLYVDDKAKRPASAITRVRACFSDHDDPTKPMPHWKPEPSMRVQTSEGKFHAYWLTNDMKKDEFLRVQQGIIAKYGSDRTIKDLSRVMRVPGFAHVKDIANPQPVRLVAATGRRYSAATLLEAFPHLVPASKYSTWEGVVTRNARSVQALVEANWPGEGGVHHVPCPWDYLHTADTGASATVYFAPNDANNGRGGFKCQHAHCAHRTISDFEAWILQQAREAS